MAFRRTIGAATPMPEGVKSAVSSVARTINRVLHMIGTESPKADFFEHAFMHPLCDAYFSQAPIRYGNYVAKIAAFPSPELQSKIAGITIDSTQDEDGFRHAVIEFFVPRPHCLN